MWTEQDEKEYKAMLEFVLSEVTKYINPTKNNLMFALVIARKNESGCIDILGNREPETMAEFLALAASDIKNRKAA